MDRINHANSPGPATGDSIYTSYPPPLAGPGSEVAPAMYKEALALLRKVKDDILNKDQTPSEEYEGPSPAFKEEVSSAEMPGSGFRRNVESTDLLSAPVLKEEVSQGALPGSGLRLNVESADLLSEPVLKDKVTPAALPGSGLRRNVESADLLSEPVLKDKVIPVVLPGSGLRGNAEPADLLTAPVLKDELSPVVLPGSALRGNAEPADLLTAPVLKDELSPVVLPGSALRGNAEPADLLTAPALKDEVSPVVLPGSGLRGNAEPADLLTAPVLKDEVSPVVLPGSGLRGNAEPADLLTAPVLKDKVSPVTLPGGGLRGNGEPAGLLLREGSPELDINRSESRFPSQGDKDARNVPFEAEENLGNSILQSLARESSPAQRYPSVGAADQPIGMRVDLDKMEALIAKVANRVLVTDPQSGQNPEVRVRVAPDLMPGTEVKLWKGDGGRLHIEFDTTSPQWAKVLSESVSVLADRLGARIHLHETPEVTVRHSGGDMPGDGRSRQGGSQQQQQQRQHDPETGE